MTDHPTFQPGTPTPRLTPAEHAAWELAHRGLSQRTIALALGISRSAVRARLENATRKLNNKTNNQ